MTPFNKWSKALEFDFPRAAAWVVALSLVAAFVFWAMLEHHGLRLKDVLPRDNKMPTELYPVRGTVFAIKENQWMLEARGLARHQCVFLVFRNGSVPDFDDTKNIQHMGPTDSGDWDYRYRRRYYSSLVKTIFKQTKIQKLHVATVFDGVNHIRIGPEHWRSAHSVCVLVDQSQPLKMANFQQIRIDGSPTKEEVLALAEVVEFLKVR